ncbi:MAG: ABC transporter permease [Tepidibacter sp.]|nr:ABC transporter permease [Tepidibacter sp.]MCT4509593.1 ABC transporter permease [Tepidibacter sp.]
MYLSNYLFLKLKNEIKSSKLGKISILTVCLFSILSIFAFLSPYDSNGIDMANRLQPPNLSHFFGTDIMGRDYFTRILYGGRISLSVGFLSMIISTSIGSFIGSICGYYEGNLDSILMRIVDILTCIPSFFVILVLNAYLKPGISTIIFVIGCLGWMQTARLVRAQTLSVKKQEYVLYAKTLGISSRKIIIKHIMPNIMPTIITASSISIASAILTESALSFLGMGIKSPSASWGSMLSKSQQYIEDASYLCIFPGMFILLTVLSFNILGNLLRESLEPKK